MSFEPKRALLQVGREVFRALRVEFMAKTPRFRLISRRWRCRSASVDIPRAGSTAATTTTSPLRRWYYASHVEQTWGISIEHQTLVTLVYVWYIYTTYVISGIYIIYIYTMYWIPCGLCHRRYIYTFLEPIWHLFFDEQDGVFLQK